MLKKKNYLLTTIALVFGHVLFGQVYFEQLSKAEKIEDFNYLYRELKQSYPYFGINKRVYDTDWLSSRGKYLKQIRKSKNNEAFFKILNGILNDLNNDHTDAYITSIYKYAYEGYKQAATQNPAYKPYVEELEKTDSIRSNYWKSINLELFFPEKQDASNTISNPQAEVLENIEINFIDSLSTAIIKIKSFGYEYAEEDADTLRYFFNKSYNYKNLIIDIQGNDGGSTEYWQQNIVPHLINDTINYPLVYAFKNSNRLKKFKPNYFKNTITYQDINLPYMPKELRCGNYLFRRDSVTITPFLSSKKYIGNLYLLVDNEVFSSSEALAYFFKSSNFGTVAGIRTNGDGVGTDPLILTLPNSGIIIRFTGEMGLNPDGSANDETKTVPDIIINASDKTERLNKLLKQIRQRE